jgi:hypothetical protein
MSKSAWPPSAKLGKMVTRKERWVRTLREEELSLTEYKNFADAYRRIGCIRALLGRKALPCQFARLFVKFPITIRGIQLQYAANNLALIRFFCDSLLYWLGIHLR